MGAATLAFTSESASRAGSSTTRCASSSVLPERCSLNCLVVLVIGCAPFIGWCVLGVLVAYMVGRPLVSVPWFTGATCCALLYATAPSERTLAESAALIGSARLAFTNDRTSRAGSSDTRCAASRSALGAHLRSCLTVICLASFLSGSAEVPSDPVGGWSISRISLIAAAVPVEARRAAAAVRSAYGFARCGAHVLQKACGKRRPALVAGGDP